MKEKYRIPIKSMLGGYAPPAENNTSDEADLIEIDRLQKAINHSYISDLHKRIMKLSSYYTWSKKHCLAHLTRQEFDELFRLCGYDPPEISELRFAEFNEIHRTEPSLSLIDNKTFEEINTELKTLMMDIDWQ